MRATLSLTQASLYASGAFVGVLALCAGAAALSIGGPLTSYETTGLSSGAGDAMHDAKGALKRMRIGICRRMPIALRDMAPCPKARRVAKPQASAAKPHAAASHAHTAPAPHHPLRRAAHKPHHR